MTAERCEHCEKDFAFGVYRLVMASYSYWVEDPQTHVREKRWTKEKSLVKRLCADCGFNLVNLRRAALNEYIQVRTYPNGSASATIEESMMQRQVYRACVLLEVLHNKTVVERARALSTEEMQERARMPERKAYLAQLNLLRATQGVQQEGERGRRERPVVVLVPGGARRRGANLDRPLENTPSANIGLSSLNGGTGVIATPPSATIGPARRRR